MKEPNEVLSLTIHHVQWKTGFASHRHCNGRFWRSLLVLMNAEFGRHMQESFGCLDSGTLLEAGGHFIACDPHEPATRITSG